MRQAVSRVGTEDFTVSIMLLLINSLVVKYFKTKNTTGINLIMFIRNRSGSCLPSEPPAVSTSHRDAAAFTFRSGSCNLFNYDVIYCSLKTRSDGATC